MSYTTMAAPRQHRRFSSFSLYHFIGFASLLFRFFFFHHLEREYIASANSSSSNFLWLDSYNVKKKQTPQFVAVQYHCIRITLVPDLIAAASRARFLLSSLSYCFCYRHKQTGSIPLETFTMMAGHRKTQWRVQYLVCHILHCCRTTKVNISFAGAIQILLINYLWST